jgi:hypothetical protein
MFLTHRPVIGLVGIVVAVIVAAVVQLRCDR